MTKEELHNIRKELRWTLLDTGSLIGYSKIKMHRIETGYTAVPEGINKFLKKAIKQRIMDYQKIMQKL